MNNLFNSKVGKIEIVERKLNSSGKGQIPFIHHQGARVTLDNGQKYLVHNAGFGQQAVITKAQNMSNEWSSLGTRNANTTVGQVMKVAQSGGSYNLLTNNCQHVAEKVYQMGEPSFHNKRDLAHSIATHNAIFQSDYNPSDYFKDAPKGNQEECQIC